MPLADSDSIGTDLSSSRENGHELVRDALFAALAQWISGYQCVPSSTVSADSRAIYKLGVNQGLGIFADAARGSMIENCVPSAGVERTSMVPPWATTICLVMNSPSPRPCDAAASLVPR